MTKIYFKLIIVLLLTATSLAGYSAGNGPVPIDSVDFNRIPHKKIRKLIHQQKQFGVSSFDEMQPVCYNSPDSNQYKIYRKTQLIMQDINVVWKNLTRLSPKEEFDGRIVNFGLLYSKKENSFQYRNEPAPGMEEGQILFFNLSVLSGFKNLAVALEVTRLDDTEKTVEYCYIDHGQTKGTQMISLVPTPEGYTEITQLTRYKCKSSLRSHGIYAFFHERIVQELFNNIKLNCEKEIATQTGKQ